ncbi:ribosomal protein S5 domain 2-type protein [Lipomyces japonicus]|uniref:ribosomal protein S5 domain 2-type protein n=1 Tax=Lipomyces japonicus TaxID=56871 RepID=UPI0034CDC9EE
MASRLEIFSPEGLRIDGRRWNEVRHFKCAINTHPVSSDGSSIVEQGNTKVICNVIGPAEPTLRSRVNTERASIQVKIIVAPFSTVDRRKRTQNDNRLQELSVLLEHTFEEAILSHLQPRSQIDIQLFVLAQDGGLLQACVNAASLALVDAGIPMYDYVSACTAGVYDKDVLLDLNRIEEGDMPFLTMGTIGASKNVAFIQLEMKVQFDRLESMMAAAISGCHHIRQLMDEEVRRHGKARLLRAGN